MRSPRLSRLMISSLAFVALLAACGEDTIDNVAADTVPPTGAPATGEPVATDAASDSTTDVVNDTVPAAPALPKPDVEIPDVLPTELVITDLTPGTGAAAVVGDTVVVHYVGVRSEDGTEFDNSYDRGSPFPVTLGTGSVIEGWEQGLVGVQQGGRRQLDIPADLAYGDTPQGDIIQPGDALTFVVDVVAVIPVADPAAAPDVTVEGADNVEELAFEDLVDGDGPALVSGQSAVIQIVAFRSDTGEQLSSTWEDGQPVTFTTGAGEILPGIELGMEGMHVGGRRQVTVPFLLAFGDQGNENMGLPASTDLVLVIDLVTAY